MLVRLCNDARLRSWNQPVLSNKGKVSCSRKRTGVFDEARTHYFHITSQTCNTLHHAAPFKYASQFHFLYWIVVHDSFAANVFERRYSAWNTKIYVYRKLKQLWNLFVFSGLSLPHTIPQSISHGFHDYLGGAFVQHITMWFMNSWVLI